MPEAKQRSSTVYAGEKTMTREKRAYVIAGGANILGRFVKIEERVGLRRNFVFVPIGDVKEFCEKVMEAAKEAENLAIPEQLNEPRN
jgi:hypothetical protein